MLHTQRPCFNITFPATLQRSAICSGQEVLVARQGVGLKYLQKHLRSTAGQAPQRFCRKRDCTIRMVVTKPAAADCTATNVAVTAPANGEPRAAQLGHEANSKPFDPSKYAAVASVIVPPSCSSADCANKASDGAAVGGCAGGSRVAEVLCELLPAQFPTTTAAKRALRRGRVSLDGRPAEIHTCACLPASQLSCHPSMTLWQTGYLQLGPTARAMPVYCWSHACGHSLHREAVVATVQACRTRPDAGTAGKGAGAQAAICRQTACQHASSVAAGGGV
jgi:hypothetical protein